jgi:catechol 2,3-dioxygenase-like lactoylglutathione lyase family enzyme
MKTKIRHIALNTENWDRMAKFYQTIFGMKKITTGMTDEKGNYNPNRGHISDGVIGLAMLQKHPGNQSGLDHFGFEVEDIPTVQDRMRADYPDLLIAKSLPHVPFSVARGTDPAGTQYDISQQGVAKVREGYVEKGWDQPRHVSHISIRSKKPERVAEFYHKVFELNVSEAPGKDGSFRVTDGTVTLLIRPCDNTLYRGMREGLDHIGFRVEDLERTKKDIAELSDAVPESAPANLDAGRFGPMTRADLEGCVIGKYAMADPDGILLDLCES